ncbi:MAG: aldo/keto reductase [Phycisphaerae bacterium]
MQKRTCGRTGLELTIVNFGGMRIHGSDAEAHARLVRQAAEAGFNYFETSNSYCSGSSETKIGMGLAGFPRQRVHISSKCGCNKFPTADSARKVIEESLRKLRVDYLDFYQLWGLGWRQFNEIAAVPGGTLEGIRRAMSDGLIRHLGFTTHDSVEGIIKLLRTGEFESVTLPYNVLDRVNAPAIAEAGRLGLGVVVMCPLHGGILGYDSPTIRKLMGGPAVRSTADAAFRFVLSNPNVTCAISGMTAGSDIVENCRTATEFRPMSAQELAAVDAALKEFKAASEKLCTGCRYCMPCEQGVGISEIFRLANAFRIYGLEGGARRDYALFDKEWPYEQYKDASACSRCRKCQEKCPQKISIPEELAKAHEILAGK